MPATISWPRSANSGPRWSIVGIAVACNTRSDTLVGPGICRKWRPVCGGAVFFIGGAIPALLPTGPSLPRGSIEPVEPGGVVVRQLLPHLGGEPGHLALDRRARIGPHPVGMGVVGSPQQMALAKKRDQRHRGVVFLKGRPDLPFEQFAGLGFQLGTALVGPELLGLPQPPVAVVELLHEPGQPAGAALGDDDFESRMAFEDAPGKQVDKRFEKIGHKEFGVLEHARRFAGGARVAIAEYGNVP